MCYERRHPRVLFDSAFTMHARFVGSLRTVPFARPDQDVEELYLQEADEIHRYIEQAAAASHMMVAADFHAESEYCTEHPLPVWHIASWSTAFSKN